MVRTICLLGVELLFASALWSLAAHVLFDQARAAQAADDTPAVDRNATPVALATRRQNNDPASGAAANNSAGNPEDQAPDQPADEPASEATKNDAADTPASEAQAKFKAALDEWKELLAELREMQVEYRAAADDKKRQQIAQRYAEKVHEGEAMQPELFALAEAAFVAAPNEDPELAELVAAILARYVVNDQYEQALRLAQVLIKAKIENARVYNYAGIAAFSLCQFDLAEKYFAEARTQNALDEVGATLASQLAKYAQAWPREQQLRAKEAEADELPRVQIETTKGTMVVELFENEAPNTVANFISLVKKGFYDGTPFHRVLAGFMAQGGDPQGDGTGGPGYFIACECYREDRRLHFRGSLSMAHAGRDTGGSQFFITFRPTPHLDGRHTVFGRVIEGLDVLAKLTRRDPEQPRQPEPDRIVKATLLRDMQQPREPEILERTR